MILYDEYNCVQISNGGGGFIIFINCIPKYELHLEIYHFEINRHAFLWLRRWVDIGNLVFGLTIKST